jgi:hypothetical protein
LIAAGWRSLEPGDGWYAKRFAWIPQEAAATEQPALPPPRLTAVDAPGQLRRRPAEAPAARRPGPPRESFAAPPSLPARAPRPGRFEPGAAAGEFADEAGTGRFVRRRPWPEDTDGLWRCEIKWDAGYKTSRFTATMRRPGARRGQAVAASDPFKWMLMAEPDDAAEYRAAVEALVRAVRAAGWERIDPGPEWWAERFVWRRDEPPPESLEPEPVRTDRADAQP